MRSWIFKASALVPRDIESNTSDQIQTFNTKVIEAIEVFLYSQDGKSQAAEEGRKLFYDKAAMQLTVVDSPTNISRVAQIHWTPCPNSARRFVRKWSSPSSPWPRIWPPVLSACSTSPPRAGPDGKDSGEEIVMKLRRGEDRQFRNIRVRLIRVEKNNVDDRKDDSAELSVNTGTPGQQPNPDELGYPICR